VLDVDIEKHGIELLYTPATCEVAHIAQREREHIPGIVMMPTMGPIHVHSTEQRVLYKFCFIKYLLDLLLLRDRY